jgi:hypothetical protein
MKVLQPRMRRRTPRSAALRARHAGVICAAVVALVVLGRALAAGSDALRVTAIVGEWNFTALLDGTPIGSHRFSLERDRSGRPDVRTLNSEAQFDVKLLGLTIYRYRHRVSEQWEGDCLTTLVAETDDDGKRTKVLGTGAGNLFAIDVLPSAGAARRTAAPTCTMSFAYWNPALQARHQLLDPGTGRLEAVAFTPLPAATIDVKGVPTPARGFRIAGMTQPIDVWYVGDRWSGLDTRVGDRRLTYRLQ